MQRSNLTTQVDSAKAQIKNAQAQLAAVQAQLNGVIAQGNKAQKELATLTLQKRQLGC